MDANARPLSARQARFVAEYVSCLNGKQAAIRAGYSARTAETKACCLLNDPAIKAAVEKETAAYLQRVSVTTEKTLQEIALIAYADHADYYRLDERGRPVVDLRNIPPGGSRVIAEVGNELIEGNENKPDLRKVKVKLHSKVQALDMLGKYLTLFKDRDEPPGGSQATGDLTARLRAAVERRGTQAPGGSGEPA